MDLSDKIKARFGEQQLYGRTDQDTWVHVDMDLVADELVDIVLDHVDGAVAWWGSEVARLHEEIEELKVDLMIEQEAFRTDTPSSSLRTHTINPKRRSNFKS